MPWYLRAPPGRPEFTMPRNGGAFRGKWFNEICWCCNPLIPMKYDSNWFVCLFWCLFSQWFSIGASQVRTRLSQGHPKTAVTLLRISLPTRKRLLFVASFFAILDFIPQLLDTKKGTVNSNISLTSKISGKVTSFWQNSLQDPAGLPCSWRHEPSPSSTIPTPKNKKQAPEYPALYPRHLPAWSPQEKYSSNMPSF